MHNPSNVSFRATGTELSRWKDEATRRGVSLSELIRMRMRGASEDRDFWHKVKILGFATAALLQDDTTTDTQKMEAMRSIAAGEPVPIPLPVAWLPQPAQNEVQQ